MKKVKVSIPKYMVLFYYPLALIFVAALSYTMTFSGLQVDNLWFKIPMLTVGAMLQITGLAAAIYMLYILGKSIKEDNK